MKPFKRTLVAGAILGLIGAVAGCSPAEEAKQQEPKPEAQVEEQAQATATAGSGETIYLADTIITMDEDQPRVEAVVADDDGKIVFVDKKRRR